MYSFMAKKRPETNRIKIAKMLIEEYNCKTAGDIQDVLKILRYPINYASG